MNTYYEALRLAGFSQEHSEVPRFFRSIWCILQFVLGLKNACFCDVALVHLSLLSLKRTQNLTFHRLAAEDPPAPKKEDELLELEGFGSP